jgi:hypothetical protein
VKVWVCLALAWIQEESVGFYEPYGPAYSGMYPTSNCSISPQGLPEAEAAAAAAALQIGGAGAASLAILGSGGLVVVLQPYRCRVVAMGALVVGTRGGGTK